MTSAGHSTLGGVPICSYRSSIKAFYKPGGVSIEAGTLTAFTEIKEMRRKPHWVVIHVQASELLK